MVGPTTIIPNFEQYFQKKIQEGKITPERLRSLEEELEQATVLIKDHFESILGENYIEVQKVILRSAIAYVLNSFYANEWSGVKEYSLGERLPHFESDFLIRAAEYLQGLDKKVSFGIEKVLSNITEYFHQYSTKDQKKVCKNAFAVAEESLRYDYKHFPYCSLYAQSMSEGEPEIVLFEGKQMLKIYRGIVVPTVDTLSEGDERERERNIIDLQYPGVDWSPIRKFADGYAEHPPSYHHAKEGRRVLFSALVPLDDPTILHLSIQNSDMDGDWRSDEDKDLEKLTDCLIVVVPERKYHLFCDLKIEYAEGNFEIKR